MILPLSQSKVKTDPLQAKARAFAGLSFLSPSLSTSFPRVTLSFRQIAATTEQAHLPEGFCSTFILKIINCALRFIRSAAFLFLRLPCVNAIHCQIIAYCAYLINPFQSRSVSRCVARDEVFYISLPCECGPLDWQEFRQVSQASF